MAYVVTAVSDQTRPWSSQKAGPMVSYRVHLQDPSGQVSQNVELAQKAATSPPQVGQQLEGNIDNTDYGLKFKKAFQQGGGGGGFRGRPPEETAAIVRQHSQATAIAALDLALQLGVVNPKPTTTKELIEAIRLLTDVFDNDVKRAKDAAA